MAARFIDHYNQELAYMHQLAKEFAAKYPKVAARLKLTDIDGSDPFIERLMQGTSFLSAGLQQKMDAEFPEFTQSYLHAACPESLSVLPSAGIVQFRINNKKGNLNDGIDVPRGTHMRARPSSGNDLHFTTTHDLKLWPLELVSASASAPDLKPFTKKHPQLKNKRIRQVITLQINITGGIKLHELKKLDALKVFVNDDRAYASNILEAILSHTEALIYHDPELPLRWSNQADLRDVDQAGLSSTETMFPDSLSSDDGQLLINEYFAIPQKFQFLEFKNLNRHLKHPAELAAESGVSSFQISLFLNTEYKSLESLLSNRNFKLFCTPIVNLFEKEIRNIFLRSDTTQYPLNPDGGSQKNTEVAMVKRVRGVISGEYQHEISIPQSSHAVVTDFPGYSVNYGTAGSDRELEPDAITSIELTKVNVLQEALGVRHLSVDTLCSNHSLPLYLNRQKEIDFRLDRYVPVDSIDVIVPFSAPLEPHAKVKNTWHLINRSSLNFFNFGAGQSPEKSANALKEYLGHSLDSAATSIARQISSIRKVTLQASYGASPEVGNMTITRILRIILEVDETHFNGSSPVIFGTVIAKLAQSFISEKVACQLELYTSQRGLIHRGRVKFGKRTSV